jgi:hypothetical protein
MSRFWSPRMCKGYVDGQVLPPSHPIRAHQTRTGYDVVIVLNAVAYGIMLLLILPRGPDVASGCLNEVQLWLLRSRCSEWHDRGVLPLPTGQPAHPHPHLRSFPAPGIRSPIPLLPLSPTRLSAPKSELTWLTAMGAPRLDWECDLHPFRIKSSGTTDHDSAVVGWP